MDELFEKCKEIMADLIQSEPSAANAKKFNVALLINYWAKVGKKKITFAKCWKIPDNLKPLTNWNDGTVDFAIEIFEKALIKKCQSTDSKFAEFVLRRTMLHELMHIGDDGKLVSHDTQDFKYLLDKFGLDWCDAQTIIKL